MNKAGQPVERGPTHERSECFGRAEGDVNLSPRREKWAAQ